MSTVPLLVEESYVAQITNRDGRDKHAGDTDRAVARSGDARYKLHNRHDKPGPCFDRDDISLAAAAGIPEVLVAVIGDSRPDCRTG